MTTLDATIAKPRFLDAVARGDIIGISSDGRFEFGDGYDALQTEVVAALTVEEKVKLADKMIERWRAFREAVRDTQMAR